MILTLENLYFNFDNNSSFSLSMTIYSNSIFIIRGFNGIGKTTLLRTIAGIIPSNTGAIKINGVNIRDIKKPFINYIGHNLGLKPELTVIENIERYAEIYNSKERINAAIHYFGLNEMRNEKCYNLSAGNQKKVALSRLLACNAKIWLLDEVENNLDEMNRTLLINCINIHATNGGIVILTTHAKNNIYPSGLEIKLEDYQNAIC